MSIWSKFYENRVGNGYFSYACVRYEKFIKSILDVGAKSFREEGCGIGTISKAVMNVVGENNVQLFDYDKDQVELSKKNLNISYVKQGNIFENNGKVDCIFSHGVIEHFSDAQIFDILNRQKDEAKYVIHYVPTNGYLTPSFGDERLMPVDWWIKNFKPTQYFTFNENKDLVLIW